MLRWSSVRRRSGYWDQRDQLQKRYGANHQHSQQSTDSPNAASAGCSRSATVGTPRFRRAMTTEVPDADGHEMMVVSKSRMQSAKRRRSMWAERYSNQQWAQITLVGSDRPELASANESLGGAGGSRNGSKNNSMDRPAEGATATSSSIIYRKHSLGCTSSLVIAPSEGQMFPTSIAAGAAEATTSNSHNHSNTNIHYATVDIHRGGGGGSLSLASPPALLAIDDDEEYETDTEYQRDITSQQAELLPRLPKSRSRHSGLRKTSFCENVIQKDEELQQFRQLNGGSELLRLPTPVPGDGIDRERRPSILQVGIENAAKLMRRRRSSFAREKWASKLEFLLAVIGYAVDLGNIWRFPSVCYKHGGGAFLIPYIVMLLVGGLPMFYMELVLGQFHRAGCLSIWKKICPMFKGIGYGICFICTFISCFYNAVIAHAVYFFISSVGWEVPWMRCNNSWNTKWCRESLNASHEETAPEGHELRTPSQEFYIFSVLESDKSTGFDDLGGIKPSMAFCLFLVFLIVYFALWKGPRSTGKIVWVTATAPYVVLSILLIRGLTLPGASKGIYYYLMPDFDKLWEPAVWTAAATQIFFSLGPGFGVLLALSSYNDFNNNCYRDAVVTSIINCFTSFFSGFVIFSTLGYMSELTNRPVSEVVGEVGLDFGLLGIVCLYIQGESSLIFVVYPQAIATMDYSPIWSLIFFLMLITLGIDSTFSGVEAFITGFCDEYPRILARKREIFVGFVIVAYYIGSLPTVTYGGTYVIPFLDEYGVSLSVLFIVVCEMIAVCWFYGIRRFSEDIRTMLGFYPGLYWRVCWTCCPVFICIIFLLALYSTSFQPMQIPNYTYPWWSVPLGWLFRMLSCLSIPAYAIYLFIITPGSILTRIKFMITAQPRTLPSAGPSSMTLGGGGSGIFPPPSVVVQPMTTMPTGNGGGTNGHQNNAMLLNRSSRASINSRISRQSSFGSSIAHL